MTVSPPSPFSQLWTTSSKDRTRQVLTCVAAVSQVLLPTFYGPRFRGADAPPNVIQPANYTFTVWFPIFASSGVYAIYQARTSSRTREIWREAGWPLAGAFAVTGLWAPLARSGRFWSAQTALTALAVLAETGRRRIAQAETRKELTTTETAVVAPAAGMLSAWGQAACGVNLAAILVSKGIVPSGPKASAAGATLLAVLGALGTRSVTGPDRASLSSRSYAGTLLWAFTGVVVGQRKRSRLAVAAAGGAALTMLVVGIRARDENEPWIRHGLLGAGT